MSQQASLEEVKGVYSNPNGMPFADGKNLHMDLGKGDLANRVITVGSQKRAEKIAAFCDGGLDNMTKIVSGRGFCTFTGTYNGVSVSIVSIGMGPSMMDFFVRESRAVVDGPMAMCRFGTCGGISPKSPPGSIVVAKNGSGFISRNVDAFSYNYDVDGVADSSISPYVMAKVAPANTGLSELISIELTEALGSIVVEGTNVTAESFYSSQGRIDENFTDKNENLIESILKKYPDALSMEMETFTLLHLALCSNIPIIASAAAIVVANRCVNTTLEGSILDMLEESGGHAILKAICKVSL